MRGRLSQAFFTPSKKCDRHHRHGFSLYYSLAPPRLHPHQTPLRDIIPERYPRGASHHHRRDDHFALWVTHPRFGSERLGYDGLRAIIHRRSVEAKVEEPSLHDFRRAFALAMLRNGTDVYTLAKLMGHEGITPKTH